MQRRPASRCGVRIGAALEEHGRQLIVRVSCGDEKCVDPHLRSGRSGAGCRVGGHTLKGIVGIRPRVEQGHRGVDLPLSRGEEERREADLRPVVDVGAAADEHPHDVHVALGGGPHQRGLSAPALLGVDLGAAVEQERGRVHAARARGRHEHGFAVERGGGIGARGQQACGDRRVAVGRRQHERLHAVPVRRAHVGAATQQEVGHLEVVPVHRPVQRRRAVGVGTRWPPRGAAAAATALPDDRHV